MRIPDEYELVLRLHDNDTEAFDSLYHKYSNAVYLNIFKLTRDVAAAEDILQEVFTSLWINRAKIDPAKLVGGWLFVVSYHKSLDYLKSSLKHSLALSDTMLAVQDTDEQDSMLKETRLKLLEEAIKQLSPQKRKVFELCKCEGKSYEETAKELAISKHTVKEYLSAAVAFVKTYIREHPEYHTAYHTLLLGILLSS